MNSGVQPMRALLAISVVIGLIAALIWATEPLSTARTGPEGLNAGLALLATGLAWLIVAWAGLVLATEALATLPGVLGDWVRGRAWWLAPAAGRQLARAVLGVGILAGPMTAAAAATPPATFGIAELAPPAADDQLPGVGRPAVARPGYLVEAPSDPVPVPSDPVPTPDHDVVVEPGDSLWSIAADHLGDGAAPAAVATEWPRWFAANRDEIGPDPDLILPGSTLHPPPSTT